MTPSDASHRSLKTPELSEYQSCSSRYERNDCNEISEDDSRPKPTIGQFSFAPTTQTTIVTTTTTTMTKFPPLIMHPPRVLQSLDPKQYPLAAAPTPESLRDIRFNLNGKSIVLHEPDDAPGALAEQGQEELKTSAGNTRSATATTNPSAPISSSRGRILGSRHRPFRNTKRAVSPVPFAGSSQASNPSPSRPLVSDSLICRHPRRRHLSSAQDPCHVTEVGLATPETESASFALDSEIYNPERTSQPRPPVKHQNENPPAAGESRRRSVDDGEASPLVEKPSEFPSESFGSSISSEADNPPTQGRRLRPLVSRLLATDQSRGENIPLPSPRLSPVTAMNSLQQETSFDSAEDPATDTDSVADQFPKESNLAGNRRAGPKNAVGKADTDQTSPSMSLMDMPVVLGYFDSIPDELKSYFMYQLLRRCPKPTLQLVADVVNPALKCDFLALLPLELSLNIVKFLDVVSMCRASQVSKKWRHIINSDEKTWKAHFDAAGFTLPEGELQRAIEEGWGWQYADDYERDLRLLSRPTSEQSADSPESILQLKDSSSLACPRRPKRKAESSSPSRRQVKKQSPKDNTSRSPGISDWLHDSKVAEVPYAAASAAALAVPYPNVGLPSLQSLHLYKSLYQRHHLIRKRWMDPNAKPQHLAFQAHDRHVVTCLQFDTDKILTGSDDTNIHVYDTKTGALRATLEGHEGGVWALEYHGNTLVSGSTDRSVRVWDIEKAECTQTFHGHTSTVRCLQILLPSQIGRRSDGSPEMMPKEPLIITGSRDSSLRVWRLPQPGDPKYFQAGPDDSSCPYFIRALNGHTHSVRAIAAHGDTLVSGSYDCTVRVWKISTGEAVHRLEGHTLKVYSVVLDHKRNRCISGSMDHSVKIWSLETGTLLYNLEGHSLLVGLLDLRADKLVSAAADSTLRIWDPETGQCKSTLTAHTGAITCFEHDDQKIISGSDRTLKMWDIKSGECLKDLLSDLSGMWQVRFNDRRCVAAVQRDGLTYIEMLDFGASRDRVPIDRLGRRIVVDRYGGEVQEENEGTGDRDGSDE
ncbi:SCF ubiquitin ligase complex subunit cdc4 [Coccidioides posadasii str. Silveira]|uniref:SCF ubiquitin ligase complex subunit cdc4 n=1 Tax=Coccidioides posadasii (strain RMSCC 757 / Silveira) TaxID=443226 RepID=UPI001BEE356B|nr:SCF ubiquitin ligase complex subunit cdc4 [Coccidioides posadasii str. Silveira]